jgi:hypothetical protein
MSSSSRISDEKAVDLNRLNRLTTQINKLQNIRFEGQVEHLIQTDPDWQVVFDRIEDKRTALEQVYHLIQEKRVDLEQAKKELEALLHKQITHDKRRDATQSFKGFAQDAIFHHWLTFTDNSPEALSLVNVRFYNQINDPMYWRLRLQRDFNMSPSYFSLITKNEDKITAVAKMKMVHQRLSDVKSQNPSGYRLLYQPIIENGIAFPPLTTTTITSLSALDGGQVFFYLQEALRLHNNVLAENLLVLMFDDLARFSSGLQLFEDMRCVTIAEKSKNLALLHNMAANHFGGFNQEDFDRSIEMINRQNAWSQLTFQSNEAGTLYLNDLIDCQQYQLARELLQTGVAPDTNTLMKVLELTQIQNGNEVPHEFTYYVLSLSKQYPTMLCEVWENEYVAKYRGKLYDLLRKSPNTQLIQTVYDVLRCHVKESNLSPVLKYLLKSMAIHGEWLQLKPHLKSTLLFSSQYIDLMNDAIAHDQLALLKELMSLHQAPPADDKQNEEKQIIIELEELVLNESIHIRESVNRCQSVEMIQYLLEELRLPLQPGMIFSNAVGFGHLAVVKYFVDKAPQTMRQTPTPGTLRLAIGNERKDVVQYLAEECGILPQAKHIETAISIGSYDVSLYLIRLRSKMTLSLSDQTLYQLLGHCDGYRCEEARQLFNWITGPEGRKHGFQFNINHLRVTLNRNNMWPRPVPESMALSPEFLGLFQQLEDNEKNHLFTQIFRVVSYMPIDDPMNIDRSAFSVCKMLVNNMKADVDAKWFSLDMKINLFALALAYQDQAFAKMFLNQENKFLYLDFSWDYFSSHEMLKYNAYQIRPEMLAWLETTLNIKIPDATLNAILDQYVGHSTYIDMHGDMGTQYQQAIQRIFLTAFNKHRDFCFSDPQFTMANETALQEEKATHHLFSRQHV